jgi:hypothetical protein
MTKPGKPKNQHNSGTIGSLGFIRFLLNQLNLLISNGGRGIRTPGTVPRTAVVKGKSGRDRNQRKPGEPNDNVSFPNLLMVAVSSFRREFQHNSSTVPKSGRVDGGVRAGSKTESWFPRLNIALVFLLRICVREIYE